VQVTDAAALQAECERLLASESDREALAGRGRAMIAKYAGASGRYAEAVERLLAARAPQQPLGAGDRDARETEA
jgi:3-deoxy-D-manno-octulosonic-acid transferase